VEKHDVAIIGGGIAGLTLAKFLAEQGIDFVLLEEHNGFFKKACGEGITRFVGGYDFFDLYESHAGIEKSIDETNIYTKYGVLRLYMPVLMTDKEKIESELARQAIKRGADIRMNEKVAKIEKGENFILHPQNIEAKLLVGADGLFSITRKFLGLKKLRYAVAVEGLSNEIELDVDKIHVEMKKSVVKYGYSWFFPKKNEWNIGIGSLKLNEFKKAFNKFKMKYNVKKWKAGYVPVSKPVKPYGKNVILLGDAASQTIASVGAGNMPSMICARIAADAIKKFAIHDFRDIDTKEYEKALHNITKMLKQEHNLAFLMYFVIRNEYIIHKLLKKFIEQASQYYKKLERGEN